MSDEPRRRKTCACGCGRPPVEAPKTPLAKRLEGERPGLYLRDPFASRACAESYYAKLPRTRRPFSLVDS